MKYKGLFITLILAAVLAFSACGSSQDTGNTASVSESSKAGSEEKTEEKSEPVSEEPAAETSEASEPEEEAEPAEDPAKPAPGRYYLVGMTQDGETVATKDLVVMSELGFEMYIMLNEDGSGELNLYGESTEMTWDEKGITSNDETVEYSWDGKYLILADGETSLTFSTMTAQEVIDAGEGVEGTMSFFEDLSGDGANASAEATAEVKIVGADWVKNYEDREVLVVWFDLTNISGDYIYASWDAYTTVTQDGNTLEYGYVDTEDVPETANIYRSIRPGVTLRCANTFLADKNGGPITYRVTSGMQDTEIFSAELDPAALPGAPTEPFELAKIDTIDWLDGASESGVHGEGAAVAIKDAEVREDAAGNPMLRVWFSYTNESDEAASFFTAVNVRAVQDGVSLLTGYLSFGDEDAERKNQEVEPGGSLDVCIDYQLISDSPVAVEFMNFGSGDFIAKAFDIK